MSDTISHIRSILDNYDSTQKAEDKLQAIASAIQQVASKPTNDKRDSDEVAVLKLEINNLKGKLGDYQAKMNKSHSELVRGNIIPHFHYLKVLMTVSATILTLC